MSVRIYQLSKQIGMTNNALLELLRGRGFNVKSASSTIDNISAESLVEEFGIKVEDQKSTELKIAQAKEEKVENPTKSALLHGVFVKSKEEVERERRKRLNTEGRVHAGAKPKAASRPRPVPLRKKPEPSVQPAVAVVLPPSPPAKAEQRASSPSRGAPPPHLPVVNSPKPAGTPEISQGPEEEEPSEEKQKSRENLKILQLKPPIVVRDFARHIGLKPFRLISELMELGIFASMNQVIEEDVALRLAEKHGYFLEVRHRGEGQPDVKEKKTEKPKVDENKLLEPRPPVVCILGHVDHGKTTLLDTLRQTNVVSSEAGGITQHIGAYQIEHQRQKITFIDTPGHAAFSKMRARGAHTTDIAILIVAADDGFMPQTDEALSHARAAGVPVIVAINKIDCKGANVDRVKTQMQERNITPEEWGGETLTVAISALKGENIDDLLDNILLQAEIMEDLKANYKCPAEGIIIEGQKEVGRGATASVIVQRGSLERGDALVCGPHYCKVRALSDDRGRAVKSAVPSTPVKVIGWSGPPDSGAIFKAFKNEKQAKIEVEKNIHILKRQGQDVPLTEKPASLESLFAAITETQKKIFRVVVKADVYGTAEALAESLKSIESDKVELETVQTAVGSISKNDVLMASASEAAIVGFNVNMESGVSSEAKHHNIQIYLHNIIYELIAMVKEAMTKTLDPELRENKVGVAEVRQIFPIGKGGGVAGCLVTEGRIVRDYPARLIRGGEVEIESKIMALKRFKDDATEVRAGYECGIRLTDFDGYEEGDLIECFEILKIRPSL